MIRGWNISCFWTTVSVFVICFSLFPAELDAQFNNAGLSGLGTGQDNTLLQNNQDTTYTPPPKPSFTFRQYFSALAHRDTMPISYMWAGSVILPGTAQIYNRDYWKLPVIYGGIGAFIYTGYLNNRKFLDTGLRKYEVRRNLLYAGAILTWWGAMMDGVVSYKSVQDPLPARASLYSALLPGLGQVYNGDYWKIPIFYGGLVTCGYLWNFNQQQYRRYKDLHNLATAPDSSYDGPYSAEDLKWRRDVYRRYRDYSVIATVLVYVLNIVDANVFAYMHDFDVSDDLSFRVEPAVIEPLNIRSDFASSISPQSAFGLKMNIRF